MARTTTAKSKRKPAGVVRAAKAVVTKAPRPSLVPATTKTRKTSAPAKPKAAATQAGQSAARAPIQSKQELRDRIEKLERANVVLRAKNREAIEAARAAANRIDELEERLGHADAPAAVEATLPKPAARRGRKPKPAPAEPAADETGDDEP